MCVAALHRHSLKMTVIAMALTPTEHTQILPQATATVHDAPSTKKRYKRLELSRPWFRIVWVLVVVVGLVDGLFALLIALIYFAAMNIRGGYMVEGCGLLRTQDIPVVAATYAAFAVLFLHLSLRAVIASMRARQLVFFHRRAPKPRPTNQATSIAQRVHRAWLALFRENGPLEVTPETFEFLFLLREIIEVTTQSYQAYKCSLLISQRWINNFYVGILALNCWVAPLIHWKTRRDPVLQRFLYLCSDVALDFAATLVVPVCIIYSVVVLAFVDNLNLSGGDMEYAFDVPYDDVFIVNLVKSVQQVFVVTWLDFVTKMLPFISMVTCLQQIVRHVQPAQVAAQSTRSRRIHVAAPPPVRRDSRVRSSALASGIQRSIDAGKKVKTRVNWIFRSRLIRWIVSVRVVHTLFFVWGVTIVILHLDANSRTHSIVDYPGCKASSQPWFVTKFSCTVLEINCYRRGYTGDADEIAAALDEVDASGVVSLIVTHCPALYVPPQLQSLSNLMWMEIHNATLIQWDEDAALVHNKLPALQYLSVNRVNMSTFPIGLQSTQLPRRLRDITLAELNITTLPSDLDTKWIGLMNLYIERTQMKTLPASVARMCPDRFSLLGNTKITSLPDELFAQCNTFQVFSIARTSLTKWPSATARMDLLYHVLMDYTAIKVLPQWLIDEGKLREATGQATITVSAGGSAYCAQPQPSPPGLLVVCRLKKDQEIEACPLTTMQRTRVP